MNRHRVAALLRELADEVERGTPTAEDRHDERDHPTPTRKPKPPALEDCGETYKSLEWGPLRCVKRAGHKGKRHRDASGVWWERMP